ADRMESTMKRSLVLCALMLSIAAACSGQITNVTNNTSTPMPGTGHDYIHMLNETVNPANGSVSVRIDAPAPAGRLLSLPFGFAYDTNGVHHIEVNDLGSPQWGDDAPSYSKGGWSYL